VAKCLTSVSKHLDLHLDNLANTWLILIRQLVNLTRQLGRYLTILTENLALMPVGDNIQKNRSQSNTQACKNKNQKVAINFLQVRYHHYHHNILIFIISSA